MGMLNGTVRLAFGVDRDTAGKRMLPNSPLAMPCNRRQVIYPHFREDGPAALEQQGGPYIRLSIC